MRVPSRLSRELYWAEQRFRGRGGVQSRLRDLLANQERSSEEIAELQAEKLRGVVGHAYRTVPYYRRLMDEYGVGPADIEGPADLRRLPLLSRATLRRSQKELVSTEADHATLHVNHSSGSTGERAVFRQDLNFRLWMRAHQLRTYGWCGDWHLGEPFVLLWGSEIYWKSKAFVDRLDNLLSNRRELNSFRLSHALVADFLSELDAFQPVLISTYPNAMHLIAREAERQRRRLPRLRAIQVTSEPVPPAFRRKLEDVFRTEVYDKYGMRETNIVSHESPAHDGMLVQSENVVAEFLREDGEPCADGEAGRVVVTTLNNRSMPLIRYETSDLAGPVAGRSAAGLPFPRMSSVAGRLQDLVITPNGDRIDAYFFSYLIMRVPAIHWFQVIQREESSLILRLYAPDGLSPEVRAELLERIHHHTRYPFRVDFESLTDMPESSTGKFRLCVCEIAS